MRSLHPSSHHASGEATTEIANKIAQFDLAPEAREWVTQLIDTLQTEAKAATAQSAQAKQEHHLAKLKIDALVLELAHLRRMRFGPSSEAIAAAHYDLFDEMRDENAVADIADIEAALNNATHEASTNTPADNTARAQGKGPRQGAGRQALPAHLPRIEHGTNWTMHIQASIARATTCATASPAARSSPSLVKMSANS